MVLCTGVKTWIGIVKLTAMIYELPGRSQVIKYWRGGHIVKKNTDLHGGQINYPSSGKYFFSSVPPSNPFGSVSDP